MKKILTFSLALGLMFSAYCQDAADKKFQAGITVGGALSFNSPKTNTISANTGGDFLVGMAFDWNFSKNVALSSGVSFDFNSFQTSYVQPVYFDYDDKEILRLKDRNKETKYTSFLLDNRKHSSIYAVLPVMLKFQTNYLGYMRYFGKFGIRNSFLLTTKTNNKGQGLTKEGLKDEITSLDKMKSKGVMNFYKGSIGLAGGAQYNITGSTVIVAEIGYYYGFSEIFMQEGSLFGDDEKSMSLYQKDKDSKTGRKYYAPSLRQGQLVLKISVLF